MNTILSPELFKERFITNIAERSRTAGGVNNISVSTNKSPLLQTDDDLINQVQLNSRKLADYVWSIRYTYLESPNDIFTILGMWYGIVHENLKDPADIPEGYEDVQARAQKASRKHRVCFWTDTRFRTWRVNYADHHPEPYEIGVWMDEFCSTLFRRLAIPPATLRELAHLLAWADRIHDQIIHPWTDGCGRISTALVMWITARVDSQTLPSFKGKKEHYESMETVESCTAYYRNALKVHQG